MIAAGRGAPASSISSRRNSAVGALPIATTAPASRSRHSSSAAAERVVPSARGQLRHARIVERADHLVAGRQARAGDAVRHHLGVAQDRRAGPQRRRARPSAKSGGIAMSAAISTMPQAWIMRTATRSSRRREAREVGLGADDGEGAAVDLRAVADVVEREFNGAFMGSAS